MGDVPGTEDVVPTGILPLDLALGVGGVPRGRIVEVYGPEASGKSTLALHLVKEAQRLGGTCLYVDAEHALDPGYAARIGTDVDALLVSQPSCAEEALDICDTMVGCGAVSLVVVDSVAALVPRAELEGSAGDLLVGLQARLMSQALRKLSGRLADSGCIALFVNQVREKVGVLYGSPEVTPGGRALKFYASVRLEVRRAEVLKEAGAPVGARTRVKVVKNKVAAPFKEATFDILFGEGVDLAGAVLDAAVAIGAVRRSGAWYSLGEEQLGQGRDQAKERLVELGLLDSLSERVKQQALARPSRDDEKEDGDDEDDGDA
jgi:recombination protein RecA